MSVFGSFVFSLFLLHFVSRVRSVPPLRSLSFSIEGAPPLRSSLSLSLSLSLSSSSSSSLSSQKIRFLPGGISSSFFSIFLIFGRPSRNTHTEGLDEENDTESKNENTSYFLCVEITAESVRERVRESVRRSGGGGELKTQLHPTRGATSIPTNRERES